MVVAATAEKTKRRLQSVAQGKAASPMQDLWPPGGGALIRRHRITGDFHRGGEATWMKDVSPTDPKPPLTSAP